MLFDREGDQEPRFCCGLVKVGRHEHDAKNVLQSAGVSPEPIGRIPNDTPPEEGTRMGPSQHACGDAEGWSSVGGVSHKSHAAARSMMSS